MLTLTAFYVVSAYIAVFAAAAWPDRDVDGRLLAYMLPEWPAAKRPIIPPEWL
jgi:hypothetical protein